MLNLCLIPPSQYDRILTLNHTINPDVHEVMKFIPLLLLVAGVFAVPARAGDDDIFEQSRKLGRGVNILGYDRIWENRAKGRFQPKYFRLIKDAGFSHVRINLFPFDQMAATNDWTLKPAWLNTLDWVLRLAHEQKLAVILDFHEFRAMGENPTQHRGQFLAFWRQLAAHCHDAPDDVLFEILNEPCKKLTPALWNDYLRDALAIIREKNATRTVIVGPASWNSLDQLPELKLPESDRNLLVTIHYYQPFQFTHQGAAWAGMADKVGVDWPGTPAQLKAIANDFAKAAAWGKRHNRPIYLGEFGTYDKAEMDARVRYTDAVARAAEAQGWSWAYWQFDLDFFVYDTRQDKWVEPLLRALIQQVGNQRHPASEE